MFSKYINILVLFIFVFFANCLFGNNNFSIIEKTFNNIENISDNNINTYSTSKDLRNSEQIIVFNLKNKKYLKSVNIVWKKSDFSFNLRVLVSLDYINWKLVKVLKIKKKTSATIIKINNNIAQFVKLYIPQDIKFLNKKYIIKIKEINFKYSENVKPKIYNVKLIKTTKKTAVFSWNTDYETFGQIRYGLDVNSIKNVKTEFNFTKNHKLSLDNLLKGTKYFYQIVNLTAENKVYTTPLSSFKTKGIPLPKLKKVSVIKKYYNGVDLKIIANVNVKIKIDYSSNPGKLNKMISIDKYKKVHIIRIRDLYPLSKYYYRIDITDKRGNKFNDIGEFTTGEYNIALNRKVYGTFKNKYIGDVFTLKGDILKRVTDGSFSYKTGMAVSFDPSVSEQYVIIDTSKIQDIDRIITYWRALAFPYFYFIYYSNDNIIWKKYGSLIKLKNKKPVRIKGAGMPLIVGDTKINNIRARFIKIYIPKGTPYYKKFRYYKFLQLVEVKVYGKCKKNTRNK